MDRGNLFKSKREKGQNLTAKQWFEKAQKEGFAIGAFNVDSFEILNAICRAAAKKNSPVMLEFSAGEVGYFGLDNIVDIVENAKQHFGIPILLNLDHAKKLEDCMAAIKVGFDDVHFDGSDLDYDKNIDVIKKIVEAAHKEEVLVEGEINKLMGSSEVHSEEIDWEKLKKSYTDPSAAAKFVSSTGVDIFAAVFGNAHGTFPNDPPLDLDLLRQIKELLPDTFLSMHGGSGIPAVSVKAAIKVGKIVKINVNTDIRTAFHDALVEKLGEKPHELAYYKLTEDMIETVMAVVEGKIDVFGSSGKA